MVFFIIGQSLVAFKRGILITPFLNYGMYSEVFRVDTLYPVFKIEQNGKLLRGQDFSPQQWDKILLPLSYYANKDRNNSLYDTEIKRILAKARIETTANNFLIGCNYAAFENWYSKYLTTITGKQTQSLKIYYQAYRYHKTLTATDSIIPLSALCH
jgi:hypothetical protein